MPQLHQGRRSGDVVLTGFFPQARSETIYPNAVANFSVRRDEAEYEYPAPAAPESDSGLISRWAVSAPFAEPEDLERLTEATDWQVVAADDRGRVNLARWASKPAGVPRGTVLARVTLDADQARSVRLGFGFSDRATVFLNGKPIFRGDNSYRSRSLRYLGVMNADYDVLYLPLREGANELTFSVSESFGGWGVMARLIDREGVAVRAAMGTSSTGGASSTPGGAD